MSFPYSSIMNSDGWYCPHCGDIVKADGHTNNGQWCRTCHPLARMTCPKCGTHLVERQGHVDPGCTVRPPSPRWERVVPAYNDGVIELLRIRGW